MLNIKQTAEYLNMSIWSLKNHMKANTIPPPYKPTQARSLWDKAILDRWNLAGRDMDVYNKIIIDLSE